ncbi:putative dehydrogenase [Streptacidiphilus sp. MAP12-16]|uniref:Gfo/Idh/MocA family protein n=1 Tax=Streptacidiphilus sp. MAP12-16 TaxID=3156300 RepID=UPI003510DC35
MKIGLLGTGPWAERTYGPALSAHPEVEFTGVWGRRPEAAAALADRFGIKAYSDADELIEDSEAVAFALPPQVQAEHAVRAATAGRHLLLEKPIGVDLADARRVADAAARGGVASVVLFTLRFMPETAAWITEQASLGGWFTARADWLAAVLTPNSGSPYGASPWRQEKGALWDVGPHALSLLLPILGDATVTGAARGQFDTVHLTFRHTGGASSTATLGLTAPPAAGGVEVVLRGEHGVTGLPPQREGEGPVQALGRAVDALLVSARTGQPHACDVRFALRVVEILAEAERMLVEDRNSRPEREG